MANVYATLDPSNKSSSVTLSSGNLVATKDATTARAGVYSTISKTSGKWYWECTLTTIGAGDQQIGISNGAAGLTLGCCGTQYAIGYLLNSTIWYFNNNCIAGNVATVGQVLGFAFDAGTGAMSFYKNNSLVHTATVGTNYSGNIFPVITPMFAFADLYNPNTVLTYNFGATALTYSPPGGFNSGLYDVVATPTSNFFNFF